MTLLFVLAPGGALPAGLLAGAVIVFVSGLIDDRWTLGAPARFGAQILACLAMIYVDGVVLGDFGRLMWDGILNLGWLAVPITVFSALGVINSFNMIDGLDGLCGTLFLIAGLALGALAVRAGQFDSAFLACAYSATAAGFLFLNARWPWNRRARVFLGDSGSALLGFLLAWLCVELGSGPQRAIAPMTAVWIIALPLLDTTRLIAGRWRRGRSAFTPDRFHLHHAFLDAGFSVRTTWLAIGALATVTAGVGVASEISGVPEYVRFYTFIAFGLAYFHILKRAWKTRQFLGRTMAA